MTFGVGRTFSAGFDLNQIGGGKIRADGAVLQGLMWRAYTSLGFLEYSFIETVEAMHPFYIIRAAGGALFLIGALIMSYNLWMRVRGS